MKKDNQFSGIIENVNKSIKNIILIDEKNMHKVVLTLLITLCYVYFIVPIYGAKVMRYIDNNFIKFLLVLLILHLSKPNDLFTLMCISIIIVTTLNGINQHTIEQKVINEVEKEIQLHSKFTEHKKEGFCPYDNDTKNEYMSTNMYDYNQQGKTDIPTLCGTPQSPYTFNLNDNHENPFSVFNAKFNIIPSNIPTNIITPTPSMIPTSTEIISPNTEMMPTSSTIHLQSQQQSQQQTQQQSQQTPTPSISPKKKET